MKYMMLIAVGWFIYVSTLTLDSNSLVMLHVSDIF